MCVWGGADRKTQTDKQLTEEVRLKRLLAWCSRLVE